MATSKSQRRFAPTPDRFPSGMVIGFPPESLIALSGILILQIELSLTHVLDRPVSGRIFFEDVIRENLDRPAQTGQLIFDRWVTKATPGSFRTRVITDGVISSLHIDYKGTRIKQYPKEDQALRTETTINNTRDFYIGKSLRNLSRLRKIGFHANRRLLQTESITHDWGNRFQLFECRGECVRERPHCARLEVRVLGFTI